MTNPEQSKSKFSHYIKQQHEKKNDNMKKDVLKRIECKKKKTKITLKHVNCKKV